MQEFLKIVVLTGGLSALMVSAAAAAPRMSFSAASHLCAAHVRGTAMGRGGGEAKEVRSHDYAKYVSCMAQHGHRV